MSENTLPFHAYGQQLTFDGYGANGDLCSDVDNLYSFLMQLPAKIGMTRIGFPHIIHIDEPGIVGLSGFVFIMESHISIHTYAERAFVTADVYSCKSFDEKRVLAELQSAFAVAETETNLQIRGKKFHQQHNSPLPQPTLVPGGR